MAFMQQILYLFLSFVAYDPTNSYFLDNAKESDLQDLMTELTILKEVNRQPHPNVIRLVGGCSIEGTAGQ